MHFSLEFISGIKLGIEYIGMDEDLYVLIDLGIIRAILYL